MKRKSGKWYGRALKNGDGMCSWVLIADDELIVRSYIKSARKGRSNATFVNELDLNIFIYDRAIVSLDELF